MIDRIPVELLTEILRISVPKPLEIPWIFIEKEPPWSLFRVCQKWRSIIMGLPEIWSDIAINYENNTSFRDYDMVDTTNLTAIARKILPRGLNSPLSLQIIYDPCKMGDWKPLVNLITFHAHRIRCLQLVLDVEGIRAILNALSGKLERLEFLSLISPSEDCLNMDFAAFQGAHNLKIVELCLDIEWPSTVQHLHWTGLTDLAITGGDSLTPFVAHAIVRQCPRLIALQLTILSDDTPTETAHGTPSISIPFLQTLLLGPSESNVMVDFLEPLDLPRLSKLNITYPEDPRASVRRRLALFSIISSYNQITELGIAFAVSRTWQPRRTDANILNLVSITKEHWKEVSIHSLSRAECLPRLQDLILSTTQNSIGIQLLMLNSRIMSGCGTRGTFVWPSWDDKLRCNPRGEEKYLLDRLTSLGLLKLGDPQVIPLQLRDLIKSRLQPWN